MDKSASAKNRKYCQPNELLTKQLGVMKPLLERHTNESDEPRAYLIGAGPGDIEYLTLKAIKAIGACDVLLIDELVNRQVLEFAAPDCEIIEVGKRAGKHIMPQTEIEALFVERVKAGAVVGRLKGGDPFVFGRGGEEMLALKTAGIKCAIVSGVTAGIAAAAAADIPVTHRGLAVSATFLTGHLSKETEEGDDSREPNWQALADSRSTLVIYMGLRQLQNISSKLMSCGLSPDTPAAVIENGTTERQKIVRGKLGNIAYKVKQEKLNTPSLIIIGSVVSLAGEESMESDGFSLLRTLATSSPATLRTTLK